MKQILKVGDTYQGEVIKSITLHDTSVDAEQQYDGSWVICSYNNFAKSPLALAVGCIATPFRVSELILNLDFIHIA